MPTHSTFCDDCGRNMYWCRCNRIKDKEKLKKYQESNPKNDCINLGRVKSLNK